MADSKILPRSLGGRRTDRILWPIPIRVTGTDINGIAFVEDTVTININKQGARITLGQLLPPQSIILIKNLDNNIEEGFRVIPGGDQVFGDRHEWRVEATRPDSKIWGIEFDQRAEDTLPKVLIECSACQTMAYSTLTSVEYSMLLTVGAISHHCTTCGQTTRWKPSAAPQDGPVVQEIRRPAPAGAPARKARRVEMAMRIFVRNGRGIEDNAQTRDVSKTGLCFVSARDFKVGDAVFIDIPFADAKGPASAKGRILWSSPSALGRIHGVNYLEAI